MNEIRTTDEVKENLHDVFDAAELTGVETLIVCIRITQDRTMPELVDVFAAVLCQASVYNLYDRAITKLQRGARQADVALENLLFPQYDERRADARVS